MKTITGKVLSTSSIPLSKASSILSKFANADTNASPALCAYLRRASVAFNELSQLHKELKSNRKSKTSNSEILAEEEKPTRSVLSNQQTGLPELRESSHGLSNGVESKKKNDKKKERGEFVNGSGIVVVKEKTAKKKRKSGEIEERKEIYSGESPIKKKKKRKTEEHS
ncbi:uncharacterized protein LOC123208639 [Mangifera indica]|uniref:uncharacterized protein LOC123208639 n=1 Tax=Mangifera indica TaxID=29780 RepID=UPI001CF98C3D|nr:uncharacterized protein LOC123208639 [Mangifera indica]